MTPIGLVGRTVLIASLFALAGCPDDGDNGKNALVDTQTVAPGGECQAGGIRVLAGVDDNRDGVLDQAEIDSSQLVCNGVDGNSGSTALVNTTTVPPGQICEFGGIQIDSGIDDNNNGTLDTAEVDNSDVICNASSALFQLQLLHFSDIDGPGGADDVRVFSALVDGFRKQFPNNTLVLSSGDNYIPGPEFFAAEDPSLAGVLGVPDVGRAHIAWLNALGVQASVIGNHELDQGPETFAGIIGADGSWSGALFPYLSTNIDFTGVAELAALTAADGQPVQANTVAGSATVVVNGETLGIVGASAPSLASITSTGALVVSPSDAADVAALAAEIQPAVDALISAGIDKIILLAHMQQIAIEQQLAGLLSGVDIIVAGGSNTILADANDRLREGDAAADSYPLNLTSSSGEPVMLVNTDGDFRYLGRLLITFDDNGLLLPGSVDSVISGVYASDRVPSNAFQQIPFIDQITDTLEAVLVAKDGNVLGLTDVYLDGRRNQVRRQQTNMGDLTADANLWLAQQADATVQVSLKNGGGIRSDIGQALQPPGTNDPQDVVFLPPAANPSSGKPEGGISQLDLETVLRFNNGLTLLTVTAAELADIIEYAVSASDPGATGASPGQFPQVAGMRFSFDPAQTARDSASGDTNQASASIDGDRLRNLAIVDGDGNVIDQVVADGAVAGDVNRTFRMVILDFIASCVGVDPNASSCGDGYPLKGLNAPDRIDLVDAGTDPGNSDFADAGSEQDAFAEYLQALFSATAFDVAETAPLDDNRIQNLSIDGKADTVFPAP
ncbi:MAG: DUF7151 family protein [Panacagrimonas sp.]